MRDAPRGHRDLQRSKQPRQARARLQARPLQRHGAQCNLSCYGIWTQHLTWLVSHCPTYQPLRPSRTQTPRMRTQVSIPRHMYVSITNPASEPQWARAPKYSAVQCRAGSYKAICVRAGPSWRGGGPSWADVAPDGLMQPSAAPGAPSMTMEEEEGARRGVAGCINVRPAASVADLPQLVRPLKREAGSKGGVGCEEDSWRSEYGAVRSDEGSMQRRGPTEGGEGGGRG